MECFRVFCVVKLKGNGYIYSVLKKGNNHWRLNDQKNEVWGVVPFTSCRILTTIQRWGSLLCSPHTTTSNQQQCAVCSAPSSLWRIEKNWGIFDSHIPYLGINCTRATWKSLFVYPRKQRVCPFLVFCAQSFSMDLIHGSFYHHMFYYCPSFKNKIF